MDLATWLLILIGPWLVVSAIAVVADPRAFTAWLLRPVLQPPQRPVTRPRPTRWAAA